MGENVANNVRMGDIYLVDLSGSIGSEQDGEKFCVVIQNNVGNKFSPTTIVCPITRSMHNKADIPTHYTIQPNNSNNLDEESIILFEQPRTIDKSRILNYKGKLTEDEKKEMVKAMKISFLQGKYVAM